MNLGLNINDLKSDIVNFKGVSSHYFTTFFTDFTRQNTITTQSGLYPSISSISSNIYKKQIKLENIDFINNLNIDVLIKNIEKDFIIEAQKLGYKNRESLNKECEFDIILKNKKNDSKSIILDKIDNIQSFFYKTSILGGFGFIASNFSNYINIRRYLEIPFECTNISNKHTLYGIPYIINEFLDDDVILFGRKNQIDNPGIHCYILVDKKQNIDVDVVDIYNLGMCDSNRLCRLYYKIVDIGLTPENQYLIIKTSDLQSNRCKKLNRIKELYG